MKTAVSWATRISRQIIEGILVAHQSTVLHRDIKPTNILVDAHTDRVKITDFGVAVTQGGSDRITQAGLVVGTPAYMPPEVIRGFPAEASGDIYSLGATLYHLFTGDHRTAAGALLPS
jgi:serine/threonine protein kinase